MPNITRFGGGKSVEFLSNAVSGSYIENSYTFSENYRAVIISGPYTSQTPNSVKLTGSGTLTQLCKRYVSGSVGYVEYLLENVKAGDKLTFEYLYVLVPIK